MSKITLVLFNQRFLIAITAIILFLPACDRQKEKNIADGYHLVWNDEFNQDGPPDSDRWGYEYGYLRNKEAQFYTRNRPENGRVENGCLVIEARRDNFEGHEITSASLTTKNRAEWTYGKIEVRAKIPKGMGTWPAVWTLGSDIDAKKWPRCGEIDIFENVGWTPNEAVFTVHTIDRNGNHGYKQTRLTVPSLAEGFHTYSVVWDKNSIRWYFDEILVNSFTNSPNENCTWVFDKPQYLIINLAIGGDWGGKKGINPEIFPAKFLIDYVRVYQKN